jgi:cytochrome c biogenesis protein CcdA
MGGESAIVKKPLEHFLAGLADFLRMDRQRGYEVLSIIQYSAIYGVTCFYLGLGIESLFPNADEKSETWKIVVEVLSQCILLTVAFFFIRKLVKSIPAIPTFFTNRGELGFAPYRVTEYDGEFMLGVVFVGVQLNLLSKISILAHRVLQTFGYRKRILRLEHTVNY